MVKRVVKNYALHGDVIVSKIDKLPEGLEEVKDNAVAEGEATGHFHGLDVFKDTMRRAKGEDNSKYTLYKGKDGKLYATVYEEVPLSHQEHHTGYLPAGNYSFGIQKQYDPFTKAIEDVRD